MSLQADQGFFPPHTKTRNIEFRYYCLGSNDLIACRLPIAVAEKTNNF
jgi:hypothetical protein